eukprot:scaffold124355_cov28-Tisochrysis_lutea.AAC.3
MALAALRTRVDDLLSGDGGSHPGRHRRRRRARCLHRNQWRASDPTRAWPRPDGRVSPCGAGPRPPQADGQIRPSR